MVLGALVMVIIAFAYAYMVPQYPKAGGEFTLECFGKVPAYICGWFVDMSAIGASIGYLFTCLATHRVLRRDGDGTHLLRVLSLVGAVFSLGFIVLQLVPRTFLPAKLCDAGCVDTSGHGVFPETAAPHGCGTRVSYNTIG